MSNNPIEFDEPDVETSVVESLPIENTNPLLTKVILPGQTFRLPSRGLFYNDGELDPAVTDGEVYVSPMSAFDEILWRTPDLLFSGQSLIQVFNRCIPQIKKPLNLFSKDVDFLVICLRKVSYGDKMPIVYTHNCEGAKQHSYLADLDKMIKSSKEIDPTTLGKVFEIKLPNNQIVKMHPARFGDMVTFLQQLDPNKESTAEEEMNNLVFTLKSIIQSVDGITDMKLIEEWIRQIPAKWTTELSDTLAKIEDWGTEATYKTKCKDCKKTVTMSIPVNPMSFFTQR